MASSELQRLKVALLLFDGVDVLDFSGPLEVYNAFRHPRDGQDIARAVDHSFETTLLGIDRVVACESRLSVNVEMTFAEALAGEIARFDILVIPGAAPNTIQKLIKEHHPALDFIAKFLHQSRLAPPKARTIQTVCTGALLLAAAGGLKNMRATTHTMGLDALRRLEPSATVLGMDEHDGRFVDGGADEYGNNIVTAGGVTCGIDASLYMGELWAGKGAAKIAREILEIC